MKEWIDERRGGERLYRDHVLSLVRRPEACHIASSDKDLVMEAKEWRIERVGEWNISSITWHPSGPRSRAARSHYLVIWNGKWIGVACGCGCETPYVSNHRSGPDHGPMVTGERQEGANWGAKRATPREGRLTFMLKWKSISLVY